MATVGTLLRCQEFQWEAFKSAYELTHFLRGTLYVAVDHLLGQNYTSQEDIAKAHTFVS